MVATAAQSSDHLRLSCKRRYQSSRLDIPVLALSESEDLKLLPDCNLQPSQGKLATGKNSADVQPELFEEKTQSFDIVQLKADVLSEGLICVPSAYTIRHIRLLIPMRYINLFRFSFVPGNDLADKVGLENGSVPDTLRFVGSAVRRILRWSFNDLMHACVQFNNCQLAEQLFLEVTNVYFLTV
jgi:hypothetical protein